MQKWKRRLLKRDSNLCIKAENEDERRGGWRSTKTKGRLCVLVTWSTTFASRVPTLFAELREEAEAGDGRPREDDGVLAGDVLAQLFGHEAVELRFVLQGGQTVRTLTLLQVHRDLLGRRRHTYTKQVQLCVQKLPCYGIILYIFCEVKPFKEAECKNVYFNVCKIQDSAGPQAVLENKTNE